MDKKKERRGRTMFGLWSGRDKRFSLGSQLFAKTRRLYFHCMNLALKKETERKRTKR